MYRLDKTAFSKRKAEEPLLTYGEKLNKDPVKCLEIAWYLTCSAYGCPLDIRMDKTFTACKKRK